MRKTLIGPALLAGIFLWFGCNEPTTIGSEILPGEDVFNVFRTDTFTLKAFTVRDENQRTDNIFEYSLGTLNNPVFGKTYAGIYAQLRLPTNNLNFGTNPVLDSVVLELPYRSPRFYGTPNAKQSIRVYQLAEPLQSGTSYDNTDDFAIEPAEIGRRLNFYPALDSSSLTIRLNQSFGQTLLNQSGTGNLENNASFQQFIPGLYIAPDTSAGHTNALFLLLPKLAGAQLSLYYSNAEADDQVTSLSIGSQSVVTSHIIHNYQGAEVAQYFSTPGYDSAVFLEGLAGTRVHLKFPDLHSLGDIIINKAQLILTVLDRPSDTLYTKPGSVQALLLDNDNNYAALLDAALAEISSQYSEGGAIVTETVNGEVYERYKINLVAHMQRVYNKPSSDTATVVLKIPFAAQSPVMTVLGGPNHPDMEKRMKLSLTYTKL